MRINYYWIEQESVDKTIKDICPVLSWTVNTFFLNPLIVKQHMTMLFDNNFSNFKPVRQLQAMLFISWLDLFLLNLGDF
jgi:hypothetical protein